MNSLGTRYGMMRASHRPCILGDNVSKYRSIIRLICMKIVREGIKLPTTSKASK